MSVLQILDEIAATSSKLEKEAILKRNKGNETLQRVIRLAYSPHIRFGIAKEVTPHDRIGEPASLDEALNRIEAHIVSRRVTGHAALEAVASILGDLSNDDQVTLMRVILKDLRSGFSESTANKVWAGLVPTFDVMLSHSDMNRIRYPAFSQLKADGVRCHLMFASGIASGWSRSGKEIELKNMFDHLLGDGTFTLDGELVCYKDNRPLDRKTSNGIINKAIKGTISEAEAELIRFLAWDVVDFTSTIPYQRRLGTLNELIDKYDPGKIMPIGTRTVYTPEEAVMDFKDERRRGNEGTLLKNMDHKWVPKRSYDLCKMKAIISVELKVVGTEEGTGKYAGMLGAAIVEDADGKIHCNVGTGFSDEERAEGLEIGTILTVEYNERITARGRETESLFLPRVAQIRLDKTEADSYEKILQIEKDTLK
jgi:hypothetical protein